MTVRIPQEIARRIEELRAVAWSNLKIMTEALKPESEFYEYVKLNFDTFSKALTEEYTIKKSPEDEIRWYYKMAESDSLEFAFSEDDNERAVSDIGQAKVEAVQFVLAELNVQIKGVNIE